MSKRVLILGANGKFGRHAALAFQQVGWSVHKFNRTKDNLTEAVVNMDVVVNAWNPPDYTTWERDMLTLHQSVLDAMSGSDATVIVPGNVYVFGTQTGLAWSEATPHKPNTKLGQIRMDMEALYRRSGVRTIILRAGDFIDTEASGNWFDRILVQKLSKGRFSYPGDLNTPHAWAYLPDLTRAAVQLAGRRADLPAFADIPFAGFTLTGNEMARALSDATSTNILAKRMGWWPLQLLAPVIKNFRALLTMRYLWDTPHRLDDGLLQHYLPNFQGTPLEDALRHAVKHIEVGSSHTSEVSAIG